MNLESGMNEGVNDQAVIGPSEELGTLQLSSSEEEEIIFIKQSENDKSISGGKGVDSSELIMKYGKYPSQYQERKQKIKSLFEEEEPVAMFPADCYAFISLHGPRTIFFWIGIMVFLCQMSFLLLAVLSIVLPKYNTGKVDDNPSGGPIAEIVATEVDRILRGTQVMSLLTSVIFVDSSVSDIVTAINTFPKRHLARRKDNIACMALSCILRLVQGVSAVLVSMVLVFNSNNVIEVILNFTAMNFISALDNVLFEFCRTGKYGPHLEREVKRIEELPLPVCMYRRFKISFFLAYFIFLFAMVVILPLAFFVPLQGHKTRWETLVIRVQLEDGPQEFNGCYHKNMLKSKSNPNFQRDFYTSDGNTTITSEFGFCIKTQQWYLYNDTLDDPCNITNTEKIIIQSSETDFFDIKTVFLEDWFTSDGTPADLYFFDAVVDDHKKLSNLTCESFLNDGICNDVFNKPSYNYDGGDCCAATCERENCGNDGIENAFDSNVTGHGYPKCKDPEMEYLTIQLNSFTNIRDMYNRNGTLELSAENLTYIKNFVPDFWEAKPSDLLLSLYCNDNVRVLKVYINDTMKNQTETVSVPKISNCTIYLDNTTSTKQHFLDEPIWIVNYTVYNGGNDTMADNPILVQASSDVNGKVSFEKIPDCWLNSPYGRRIDGGINLQTLSNAQSEAMKWLVGVAKKCGSEIQDMYELAVLNFAAPISGSQNRLWVQEGPLCNWPNILCVGPTGTGIKASDLFDLDLSDLRLSGHIATEIGMLANLGLYDVSRNALTGTIPSEIGLLTSLSVLNLNMNYLNGTIPSEIGSLTSLEELFMTSNEWTGTIPTEIGLLTNLVDFTLQDNDISGTLPSEIGLLTSLTVLQIGGNERFHGSIPSEILGLKNLTVLNINGNSLTGSIPSEIGSLTKLIRLSIDKNPFSGSIPSEIGLLTSLTRLDIDETDLTGSIPTEMENLLAFRTLYMDNVTIPIPASLAPKVAEKCEVCGQSTLDPFNLSYAETVVGDYNGLNYTCSQVYRGMEDNQGRIAAGECSAYKDSCSDCNTLNQEGNNNPLNFLSALDP